MTVALGLVCKDGVLVASDSMGSNAEIAQPVRKVHIVEGSPVVWTASGSVFVAEEVQDALDNECGPNKSTNKPPGIVTTPELKPLRNKLKTAVHEKMKSAYGAALSGTPAAPGSTQTLFLTDFLVLGYSNETPWFLEFARDGQINWHTEGGFYAVGSGGPFATVAHGLMAHYLTNKLTLDDAAKVAYRAIETTCQVSSRSVGLPVQIAVVDSAGSRYFSEDEIGQLKESVAGWKTLEADTLRMGGKSPEAPKGDLPSL